MMIWYNKPFEKKLFQDKPFEKKISSGAKRFNSKPVKDRKFNDTPSFGERPTYGEKRPAPTNRSFGDNDVYENKRPIKKKTYGKPFVKKAFWDKKPTTIAAPARKPFFQDRPGARQFGEKVFADSDKRKPSNTDRPAYGNSKPAGKQYLGRNAYNTKPAFGERPAYGDRKPSTAGRPGAKPFWSKPTTAGKPTYGDRKPTTAGKPFWDRKPYGDNKSGAKPFYGKPFGKKPFGKKPFGKKKR